MTKSAGAASTEVTIPAGARAGWLGNGARPASAARPGPPRGHFGILSELRR
jgi:hypothetical protein